METTLHRQLKALYVNGPDQTEVAVNGFRIDAVAGGRLIEIQHASLGAIREKVRRLLIKHRVVVVKPLAARKLIVKAQRKGGRAVSSRYSPKRQSPVHVFDDLVHFVEVFPHRRLTLEVLLTEQEERRLPSRKRRRFSKDYRVEDRNLQRVAGRWELRTPRDLAALLPGELPCPFSTADISIAADIPRWLAQKAAYCLRKCGAATVVGKRGNTLLYEFATGDDRAAA